MPDAIKKVIDANDYKNGTAVVSIDKVGVIANHTRDTVFNQVSQIDSQSGVLDSRFDDVRYYSGDTSA